MSFSIVGGGGGAGKIFVLCSCLGSEVKLG